MKNVAHVTAKDWLGSMPEPGPAFYLGAEDDEDEIHIRLAAIAKHYDVTFKELIDGGLHVLPLLGRGCDALRRQPRAAARSRRQPYTSRSSKPPGDIKPKNISIDTLSRAFAGNEIDRVQVYAFAMHMQALAMVAEGSVTVLSHPSLPGISSGSGLSGSTAWHGAFRFRQYLKGVKAGDGEQPDNDLRELEFKKNQYGPRGDKHRPAVPARPLPARGGRLQPRQGGTDAKAEDVFMDLLRRFSAQNRNVSDKATANNYAPTAFAREDAAKKQAIKKADLEQAMRGLFSADKITVEQYGKPSLHRYRLAVEVTRPWPRPIPRQRGGYPVPALYGVGRGRHTPQRGTQQVPSRHLCEYPCEYLTDASSAFSARRSGELSNLPSDFDYSATKNGAIDGALCGRRQEHRRGLPVHRRAGMASAWLSPDRRGGFRGPGPGTASGWRPSTSKPNAIP